MADSFGGVVFTVYNLACVVTAAGFGREWQRYGDLFRTDLGIVGMGEAASQKSSTKRKGVPVFETCEGGGVEGANRFKTPRGFGFIRGD